MTEIPQFADLLYSRKRMFYSAVCGSAEWLTGWRSVRAKSFPTKSNGSPVWAARSGATGGCASL